MLLETQSIKTHNTYLWNMENREELEKAVKLLKYHNEWRRDITGVLEMPNPTDVGKAIDLVTKHIENELQQKRI